MAEYERRAGLQPGEGPTEGARQLEEYLRWQEEAAEEDRPKFTVVPATDEDND
jgi:hypothetical protein